jgi:hypothetical protein
MAKNPIAIAHDVQPGQPKSSRWRTCTIFVLAVIVVPLVVEGGALCYGQWCSITGRSTPVSTPVMDTVSNVFHETKTVLADSFSPSVARVLNEPGIAIPVSLVLIGCGMMLLKR